MYYSTKKLFAFAGINTLTGEADKYSLRILCDLNKKGVETISTFFGINAIENGFPPNWNSFVNEQKAVASFMLPRGTFNDLAHFIAFHHHNAFALEQSGNGYILYSKKDFEEVVKALGEENKLFNKVYRNFNYRDTENYDASDRNEHLMSGRVV